MIPESTRLVRESWALLAADADTVARRFYKTLFELAPHTRAVFAHTDADTQRRNLIRTLSSAVPMLDDPAVLLPQLAMLGRRYATFGIGAADYDAIGAALLATLEETLGNAFTPRVREAWMEGYRTIAGVMRRAAARAPEPLTGEMPAYRP